MCGRPPAARTRARAARRASRAAPRGSARTPPRRRAGNRPAGCPARCRARSPSSTRIVFSPSLLQAPIGLPRRVGLQVEPDDDGVGVLRHRAGQAELQVAQLVAAERHAGQVVALDEDARAAKRAGQVRRFLQRRRRQRELDARDAGDALAHPLVPCHPPIASRTAGRPHRRARGGCSRGRPARDRLRR